MSLRDKIRAVLPSFSYATLKPNALVVSGVALASLATLAIWGAAGVWFWKAHVANRAKAVTVVENSMDEEDESAEHVSNQEHEGGDSHEGEEHAEKKNDDPLGLYQKIPRSIVKRQDGIPEEGHDLVDAEIEDSRSLASLLKSAGKKEEGGGGEEGGGLTLYRFVRLNEVFSGTRAGSDDSAAVIAEFALQVNSLEAQAEVESRQVEFRAVVSSLIAEQSGASLRSFEGKAQLKKQIMDDLNRRLEHGRIKDVLLQSFVIR